MKKIVFLLSIGLLLLPFSNIQAQSKLSEQIFSEKLALYSQSDPSGLLFVHTDKTLYTNNEDLWFSGYLLKNGASSLEEHQVLSLALVRESDRSVYLQDKYMMAQGLAFGSLVLPDTIPPGNYQLIASTNVLDKDSIPLAFYTQAITIKSITQQDFNATLSLIDTVVTDGAVRAKLMVTVNNPDPKLKPSFAYSVGSHRQKSIPLKSILHTITIPEEQLDQNQPVLLTEISYNGQTQYLSIKLPETKPKGIDLRFFPEGGYLVDGQESLVGWEATTADGHPLSVNGILYEDDEPIDTLLGNSYGMGAFKLAPKKDKEYTFRISKNDFLDQDTLYKLPVAIQNGVVLRLKDAVVNDTLKMELYSQTPRNVQVLLHNYREGFASFSVHAGPQGGSATIALPSLPKGIAMVTVLDEEGKPLAERLFFAHYNRGTKATFHLDKASYEKRKKAGVKLKVTNKDGKPAQGVISIAAVQKNRLEVDKRKDIETYVFMEQDLGNLPTDPLGMGYTNKKYLEDMLLVKGWRRYTWQGLINASSQTVQIQTHSPQIKGHVFRNGQALKQPITVSVMQDSLFNLITTDSVGRFILERDNLLSEPDKNILLLVNEKNKEGYTIQMEDPYGVINRKLAENTVFSLQGNYDVQSSGDLQMAGLQNALSLNVVTVTGKRDESLYGLKARGSNECGDYVDRQGFLNYPPSFNNSDNKKPVEGHNYFDGLRRKKFHYKGSVSYEIVPYDDLQMGDYYDNIRIKYEGCIINKNTFRIAGIYTDKEFYGVSLQSDTSSEPQYLSTLFWRAGILLDKKGETEFSFVTGDISGDFTILVQGIGEGDVISGVGKFTVN